MQKQTARLAEMLAGRGSEVSVVTRNYYGRPREERRGTIVIHRTPAAGRPDERAIDGAPPLVSRGAVTSALYLFFGLLWCLKNRRHFEVIQCQQMFGSMLLGVAAGFLLRKRVVVRLTLSGERGEAAQLRRMPFAGARLHLLRRVDAWVVLTDAMSEELRALGVAQDRITVIPNAVPLPDAAVTGPVASARPLVLYAGRLSAEKGIDSLLAAMPHVLERHPDAVLQIAGAGGVFGVQEDALREQARNLGSAVEFLGWIPDLTPRLLAADVFVLPTTSEGMSNAMIEAMAAGRAIVTTDIAAHRGVVEDGVTALLVPPSDPPALAAAINELLGDPELRSRLGRAARATAERRHSLEAMLSAYLTVYCA
jgi:glycosyltransferase involved in cell wall biosynthesis